MSCSAGRPTFRLLNSLVGWTDVRYVSEKGWVEIVPPARRRHWLIPISLWMFPTSFSSPLTRERTPRVCWARSLHFGLRGAAGRDRGSCSRRAGRSSAAIRVQDDGARCRSRDAMTGSKATARIDLFTEGMQAQATLLFPPLRKGGKWARRTRGPPNRPSTRASIA